MEHDAKKPIGVGISCRFGYIYGFIRDMGLSRRHARHPEEYIYASPYLQGS